MTSMEDNQQIDLHFEFADSLKSAEAAAFIQQRLSELGMVESVEAIPEEPRLTGLEIAGAIAVGVMVTRNSRELLVEVQKLIPEIQKLFGKIREVWVERGTGKVSIEEELNAS